MTTAQQRITALAQAVGSDVKALDGGMGDLPSLNTAAKNSLVEAINETNDSQAAIADLAVLIYAGL